MVYACRFPIAAPSGTFDPVTKPAGGAEYPAWLRIVELSSHMSGSRVPAVRD